jgi:hypothetical protein
MARRRESAVSNHGHPQPSFETRAYLHRSRRRRKAPPARGARAPQDEVRSVLVLSFLFTVEHEFRHFPFVADREQPERQTENEGERGPEFVVQL